MRKDLILLSAVAAVAAGGSTHAGDMSYNYVQGEVIGTHLKAYGDYGDSWDSKGLGIDGSVEIGSIVTGFADLGSTKGTQSGLGLRFTPATLGVGGHIPLSSVIDLTGGASYERVKVKASSGGESNSESFGGWGLGVGARGLIAGNFQWNAGPEISRPAGSSMTSSASRSAVVITSCRRWRWAWIFPTRSTTATS